VATSGAFCAQGCACSACCFQILLRSTVVDNVDSSLLWMRLAGMLWAAVSVVACIRLLSYHVGGVPCYNVHSCAVCEQCCACCVASRHHRCPTTLRASWPNHSFEQTQICTRLHCALLCCLCPVLCMSCLLCSSALCFACHACCVVVSSHFRCQTMLMALWPPPQPLTECLLCCCNPACCTLCVCINTFIIVRRCVSAGVAGSV
jgi:hypothetical protein